MHPEPTIILVVGERRDRAVGALSSVLAQDAAGRLEVLLCDLAPGEPPPRFEMNEYRRHRNEE